ncbi:MAG TPA: FAD-dependent oxidoreductase [Thermodesulfobacteriota bacterium]|nr:FAD-dependent oxidoreductase [Thermodesulfobacteriota bacterium]
MPDKNAVILGAGVSGLTCGVRLLEAGFSVRIKAHTLPPHTTSNVAPAYWYPYKVAPRERVLGWADFSYAKLTALSLVPGSGVSMSSLLKLFEEPVDEPFWKPAVRTFRRARPEELPPGYADGFVTEVPRIETPVYMRYLEDSFVELGGELEKLEREAASIEELMGDRLILINCAGLGAGKLCRDENTFPIRGQIVIVKNIGLERITSVDTGRQAPIYIVPRDGDCILGGTAEENNWDLRVNPETSKKIIEKCAAIEPALVNAEILGHRVGLRPGRTGVRLELEELPGGRAVIHDYGHGGAGFTLSWGCAEEVLNLAEGFLF